MKFRNSCMALFEEPNFDMTKILYACYQKEICPKTNNEHWQTYVEFKTSYELKYCQKYIGVENCHLEKRRGTPIQARDYCLKSESSIVGTFREFGDINLCPLLGSGKRTDLENLANDIKEGKEPNDIMILKYSKGIKELKAKYDKIKNNNWKEPTVCLIWGDPGAGKTKSIYDKEGYENCYKLDKTNNEVWFDGYNSEKVLIIDDFYGWIPWGQLLNILDGYPLKLQIKGSHTWKAWEKVYITSNKHYTKWYTNIENIDPLTRRIKYILKMEKEEKTLRKPIIIKSLNDI